MQKLTIDYFKEDLDRIYQRCVDMYHNYLLDLPKEKPIKKKE